MGCGYEDLVRRLPQDRIFLIESMARHTSFHVGGPADVLFCPAEIHEIREVLKWCRQQEVPCLIIGNGSNLIIRDGGFRGVIMKLSDHFRRIDVEGEAVTAQAGALLSVTAKAAARASLSGLEFAAGIPGSIGGAVVMNAGAYGGVMADVVEKVEVVDGGGEVLLIDGGDMGFGYRHSRCHDQDLTVLTARFRLSAGDPALIQAKMDDLARRRREKQPLSQPSAGSTFKRPPGGYAGQLIEEAGMKGAREGDAQVSPMHAGFIVNLGNASAADILSLIDRVVDTVEKKSGIRLEPEVKILGEDL